MNVPNSIYCSHCQEPVKPIKCIVIHRCPQCGAPFVGYTEQTQGDGADDSKCNHINQEPSVA